MKTKSRIKITPQTKPLTHLVWVDIHDQGKLAEGIHQPVAYGFVDPELFKFLNGFGLQSQYSIEAISKSGWQQISK
jgi:hypothetical protein